jgi:hypothetical protein
MGAKIIIKKLEKMNESFTHRHRNRNEKITRRQKIILIKLKKLNKSFTHRHRNRNEKITRRRKIMIK